ncbi:MAG: DUF4277 domain-containing protein [Cyanobacteria bacterium LVE1205-1]
MKIDNLDHLGLAASIIDEVDLVEGGQASARSSVESHQPRKGEFAPN